MHYNNFNKNDMLKIICFISLFLCRACPSVHQVFCVVFAVANGPLLYAIITYRNTFAFHSLDRMTSVFIHVLPSLVTFAIRWYPSDAMHWYRQFAGVGIKNRLPWEWVLAVPYAFYILHTVRMWIPQFHKWGIFIQDIAYTIGIQWSIRLCFT